MTAQDGSTLEISAISCGVSNWSIESIRALTNSTRSSIFQSVSLTEWSLFIQNDSVAQTRPQGVITLMGDMFFVGCHGCLFRRVVGDLDRALTLCDRHKAGENDDHSLEVLSFQYIDALEDPTIGHLRTIGSNEPPSTAIIRAVADATDCSPPVRCRILSPMSLIRTHWTTCSLKNAPEKRRLRSLLSVTVGVS